MKKMFLKTLGTGMFLMSAGTSAFAKNWNEWLVEIEGRSTPKSIEEIIVEGLNWLLGISALVAVAVLIFAGVMYMTANGDEAKIGKATKTLTFAIVGLVVCFIAVMLVNYVMKTFLGLE
jgi:hypothetical protein